MNPVKNFFGKLKEKIKKVTAAPVAFLKAGTPGGIILCLLLASTFFCFNIVKSFLSNTPTVVCILISTAIIGLGTEVVYLLVKLLFGAGKQSKLFVMVAFTGVFISNLIGTQANIIFPAILMSLLLTLAVNYLGKCIWAFIKTKRFRQVFGYVVSALSIAYIILFVLFWKYDQFGESRIQFYLENQPAYTGKMVEGFDTFLQDGSHEVAYFSYAPKDADIITETIDMTDVAEQKGLMGKIMSFASPYKVEKTPIAGGIWYPVDLANCPTLFIVHGAHNSKTESYLGYDYLAEYLASNGYVVVSVDENIINELGTSNDVRAILLLENMKAIYEFNKDQESPIFNKIDEDKVVIAGHSRGGEMVATAYLFNDLAAYPDNGTVKFDYHFDIDGIVAIAPTVDQYMPVDHAVEIQDVNYLVLHGSNDHDVSKMMGEKQYKNVSFSSADEEHFKASIYIMGANHGQFNTRWGRYDLIPGVNGYLNTYNFIEDEEQQLIAKAYFRTFLDVTLKDDDTYKSLFVDNRPYRAALPNTVYMSTYDDASYQSLCSFDDTVNIEAGDQDGVSIECFGMENWTLASDEMGIVTNDDNYVLKCSWDEATISAIYIKMNPVSLSDGYISFRIADMREDIATVNAGLDYTVVLVDGKGNTVSVECPTYIYPSLALQLYKQDVLFNSYEYRHQMQDVILEKSLFEDANDFDFDSVCAMKLMLNGEDDGSLILDDVCYKPIGDSH